MKTELEKNGFTSAGPQDGKVRAELWTTDRDDRGGDPIVVMMTPGQAMDLCAKLATAASAALKQSI